MRASRPSPDQQLLIALSLSQLVAWGVCYYAFAVLMPPIQAELGLSRSGVAGAYSLGLLVMGFASMPVGMLIDRGRHFLAITGGTALGVAGFVLLAAVREAWQLYAVWALIGAGMAGALYESVFAFLIRHYPDDYRRRITFVTLLGGLASTVFWPLAAALLAEFGWRGASVALAVLLAVGALAVHAIFLPRQGHAGHTDLPRADLHALLRSRPFVLLAVSFTLQSLVLAGLAAHIIGLFAAAGVPTAFALLAASFIGVMQVGGRALLLAAGTRLPPAVLAQVIVWLMPVSVLVLIASGLSPWLAFAYAVTFGTGNGMMTIVKGTAAADLISRDRAAMLNGVLAMPTAISRAAGPVVVAACWDGFGDHRWALAVVFVIAACAAVALTAAYRAARGAD